jgi:hypothetical protein
MHDRHGIQPPRTGPVGRITRISISYIADTPSGRERAIVGHGAMERHAPERLAALVVDLALICEDVIAADGAMASAALADYIKGAR